MRPGTPGFNGDRLREAREARGISPVALADMLGVTRQSINAYEQSRATPNPEKAAKAAELLNLPFAFFLEREPSEDPATIYWRSMAAATKTQRKRSRVRHDWTRKIVRFLSDYVEFPTLRLPPALVVEDPAEISDGQIEEAADRARSFLGLKQGAIENMTWLLENHGIIVSFAEFGASGIDAFSQSCSDGHAYVVMNAEQGSSVRYRFDLAHELGHLTLHRNLNGRHFANWAGNREMERQAHFFAGCFLMPPQVFAKNFYAASLDALKTMKRVWGVSMQAALQHATRLNIISDKQSEKLWRRLSVRGWRRHEPFDDIIPRENPSLLKSAFEQVLQAGILTQKQILEALPYSGQEIEALSGLDPGTLVPATTATVRELPGVGVRDQSRSDAVRRDRQTSRGDIIVFGRPDRT